MSPLRICLVSGTYPPSHCGVGDYTEMLAQALAEKGARVSVVTSSYLGTKPSTNNPTVLPIVNAWALPRALYVLRCIIRTRPQVIHFQFPTTEYHAHRLFDLLVPLLRLRLKAAKIVITLHEPFVARKSVVPGLFRPLRYWLSSTWAEAIIVVDQSYQEPLSRISRHMRRIPLKVIPIASNIPVSRLQFEEQENLRERAGIAKGTTLLSYFGFIQPRKGFEHVLDVLKILRTRQTPAELIVLGELSENNPYHHGLLNRIVNYGLETSVKVLGHLDRYAVSNYLAVSDVCVLPYVDGVHPKRGSFLAAAQEGILIVTTSMSKKGLFPNENVYYTLPGDVEDMASAIQLHSTKRVPRGSFPWPSWAFIADEHLKLFDQILSGS